MAKKYGLLKCLAISLFLSVAACSSTPVSSESISSDNTSMTSEASSSIDGDEQKIKDVYQLYLASGGTQTYEEWLNSIKGKDGVDGKTPFIGENGNWWIGDVDTKVKASGTDGKDGQPGNNGQNGKPGKNGASVLFGEGEPAETTGSELDSYVDKNTFNYYLKVDGTWTLQGTLQGEDGQNGKTPYVKNGNWWIGDEDLGVKAKGEDGVSIVQVEYNTNGELLVTLSNSQVINLGRMSNVYSYKGISNRLHFDIYLYNGRPCAFLNKIEPTRTTNGGTSFSSKIRVPALYEGYEVIGIESTDGVGIIYEPIGMLGDIEVTLPETVKFIGDNAFKGDPIKKITLPDSVTFIGRDAFYGCEILEEFNISENSKLEAIQYGAFDNCVSLESLYLPPNLSSFEFENNKLYFKEFVVDENNQNFNFDNNMLYRVFPLSENLEAPLYYSRDNKTTNYVFNAKNFTLSNFGNVLYDNEHLLSVELINCVDVPSALLVACYNVGSIIIPNTITSIVDLDNMICGKAGDAISKLTDQKNAIKLFYKGTIEEFSNVEGSASYSASDKLFYYSEAEITDGHHWHYVNDVPSVW